MDTDDDDVEEPGVETLRTVASTQRNKVVMKSKGTSSTTKRESLRSSNVNKTCLIDGDMLGREVARALAKLSSGGLAEVVSSMPPEVIASLVGYAPKT